MALSKKREVEDLADALVRSADAIHERIINGLGTNQVQPVQAHSLFQDETSLRVKANALYLEAVKLTVSDLEIAQANLIKVMDTATSRIKTIETIAGFIDLVADLLVLAAAAYAAKPGPIIAALDEVRRDLGELEVVRVLRTSRPKRRRRKARGRSVGS